MVYLAYVALSVFFVALTLWCLVEIAVPGALAENVTMFGLTWCCSVEMLWRAYREHRRLEASDAGGER